MIGKREFWDRLIKLFRSWVFTVATREVVIHANVKKAVAEGKRKQEQEIAEAACAAGCFPEKLSLLGEYGFIPGSWQVFPALTSTSEMVYPFQPQVKRTVPSNRKLLHSQLPSR